MDSPKEQFYIIIIMCDTGRFTKVFLLNKKIDLIVKLIYAFNTGLNKKDICCPKVEDFIRILLYIYNYITNTNEYTRRRNWYRTYIKSLKLSNIPVWFFSRRGAFL